MGDGTVVGGGTVGGGPGQLGGGPLCGSAAMACRISLFHEWAEERRAAVPVFTAVGGGPVGGGFVGGGPVGGGGGPVRADAAVAGRAP